MHDCCSEWISRPQGSGQAFGPPRKRNRGKDRKVWRKEQRLLTPELDFSTQDEPVFRAQTKAADWWPSTDWQIGWRLSNSSEAEAWPQPWMAASRGSEMSCYRTSTKSTGWETTNTKYLGSWLFSLQFEMDLMNLKLYLWLSIYRNLCRPSKSLGWYWRLCSKTKSHPGSRMCKGGQVCVHGMYTCPLEK